MKVFDEELERGATRRAFMRLNVLALAVPAVTFLLFYSYFYLRGVELERADWKTFALLAWLGTLAVLVREALSVAAYRGNGKKRSSAAPEGAYRLFTWEGRKSRRLCRELASACIILPVGSGSIVGAYVLAAGIQLGSRQWQLAAIVILAGTFISLVYLSVRALRTRLIYRAR